MRLELGQDLVAFRRANDGLRGLWDKLKDDPAVALKRQLWAQLLKLVYGREVESDALFFQHTFLVIVAKAIALAVLGLRDDDPRRVLSGAAFEAAGIFGAAESDFFDWVVAAPDGEALVRRILAHVRRFRLDQVESDVLKILYESLIDREERHGLGEYYTPDWLAAKIVRHAVDRPIEQRVLDPACGSGTFLFHAVRNFIKDAEDCRTGRQAREAEEATNHIAGMDIHPVAVIIARVTYLLALAPVIARRAGSLSIPVYLGDALQLSTATTMHLKELVIRVPPPPDGADLKFPEIFCKEIRPVRQAGRADAPGLGAGPVHASDRRRHSSWRSSGITNATSPRRKARPFAKWSRPIRRSTTSAGRAGIRSGPTSRATCRALWRCRSAPAGRTSWSAIRRGLRSGT